LSNLKRDQDIAVKDLLLVRKECFGRFTYRLWEKLDFYIVLVGARINTDRRRVFITINGFKQDYYD
jgi:hypothetical protein